MLVSEQFITQLAGAIECVLRTHDEAMSRCDQEDRDSIRHDTARNIVNLLWSVISRAEPSAPMVHVSDLPRAIRHERINMIRCASKSPFLSIDDVERLADLMESEANNIEADYLALQSRRAAESDYADSLGE